MPTLIATRTASKNQTPGRSISELDVQIAVDSAAWGKHMHAETLPYWGKARPPMHGTDAKPYHLLTHHCLDVAAVGIEVLKRLPALRTLFALKVGLSEHHIEPWIGFWLALHDLGKFAESFQSQCPDVFKRLRGRLPNPAKPYTLRHDSLGMLFWKSVLRGCVIARLLHKSSSSRCPRPSSNSPCELPACTESIA